MSEHNYLGNYIKAARKAKSLSGKALADAIGISKSYLDYIEAGERSPSVAVLAKLSAGLDLDFERVVELANNTAVYSAIADLEPDSAPRRLVEGCINKRGTRRAVDAALELFIRDLSSEQAEKFLNIGKVAFVPAM